MARELAASLRATGFFVLRAPLLPLEELDRLRSDPEYWRTLVARSEVREALHLASPGLMRRVAVDPDARVAASVTAYLVRMCTRATPFGLFAGCATGAVGDATALVVDGPEGTTRHSRPDTEVLASLVERLLADPSTRSSMVVEPNSSRYRAGGALRLIESRVRDGRRSHHLVVVEDDAPLRCALDAATGGGRVETVVEAVAAYAGVELAEAREYVDALVEAQVLIPVAEPAVTGPEPLAHVLSSLGGQDLAETTLALGRVSDELARLDAAGLGNDPAAYDSVSAVLLGLSGDADGDDGRLVQVDLHRAGAGLTLGPDALRLLADAVELLHTVTPAGQNGALSQFKTDFEARYARREVPLMEALDEEMGIGFGRSAHPAADESPLLAGIDLGGIPMDSAFGARDAVLLDLLMRARESDSGIMDLDADAIARLTVSERTPLPDGLAVRATLLDDGVEVHGANGPSGAELLGRFCHGDARLHDAVAEHLRAEEALAPGVVFAEVIHLPEGRVGNVLARPVLRDYELVMLGRSGASADRQITVDELTVRLDDGRLVLWSARLGAEVRPRLTTAHNPAWRGFGVYRFLAALQSDGVAGELAWEWGVLSSAPSLPRVTAGKLVLARARWRLSAAELATVTGPDPVAGWAALARDRRLPAELIIVNGDNRLYVDTASAALTASAAKVLRGRSAAVVEEVLASAVATGPGGRFANEVIVPFVRRGDPAPAPRPWRPPSVRRTFAPGDEWLYLKVFCGTASADRVLTEALAPVLDELRASGAVDHWYFLRYPEPEHHLRFRLHGDPAALRENALPAITGALTPHLGDGTVWDIAIDTYDRELERYGGDGGIELAERVHAADSDAVLEVLRLLDGVDDPDARWKLAVYATDRLLADAGLDVRQRRDWARTGAAGYLPVYPNATNLESGVGRRWRDERADITALLDDASDHPYEAARQVFRRRSERIAPLLAELAERSRGGQLSQPFEELLRCFAHLHADRLLRSAPRAHELVFLGFLDRFYASRIARAAAGNKVQKVLEKSVGFACPQRSYP